MKKQILFLFLLTVNLIFAQEQNLNLENVKPEVLIQKQLNAYHAEGIEISISKYSDTIQSIKIENNNTEVLVVKVYYIHK